MLSQSVLGALTERLADQTERGGKHQSSDPGGMWALEGVSVVVCCSWEKCLALKCTQAPARVSKTWEG